MSESINPYITDNPVGTHTTFIERTHILREIMLVLRHAKKNALVLYGQRCIGKTSLLQHLKTYLPTQGDYYPIYFDLQDKASLTLAQIITELAKSIANTLNQAEPDLEEQPEAVFQDSWLPKLIDYDSQHLKFIFTGGRNIDDLDPITISLFRGIPPTKRLSLLNQTETTKLVRLSEANNSLNWPDEAVECVWQYTHGHPYLTQHQKKYQQLHLPM